MTYTGRTTTEDHAYLYQRIEVLGEHAELPMLTKGQQGFALLGYAVDEGVRLNQGRVGAAGGPAAIRERLGREIDLTKGDPRIVDCGDVSHGAGTLFDTLLELSKRVTRICAAGYMPIVLGGGHDLAAGHYLGLHRHHAQQTIDRLGVVNFDAHLDLRLVEEAGPHSGTPFSLIAQLNEQHQQPFRYACVGAQRAANTPGLWQRAENLGAELISLKDMGSASDVVAGFCASCTGLYLTVDLDGFPSYVSPGVSAPGVEGLRVEDVVSLVQQLVATGKVVGFDVAECNPKFDQDGRTARLAARLIAKFFGMARDEG